MGRGDHKTMDRREFIKYGVGGVATLFVGSCIGDYMLGSSFALPVVHQEIDVSITDAMKQMVTHNDINDARCYFWVYEMKTVAANGTRTAVPLEYPGPTIVATVGDTVKLNVTNNLDEPHAFSIPELGVDTLPIAPGATTTIDITPLHAGAYLYYDNLNAPVNRVMGLHGAFIVMPAAASGGADHWTPYDQEDVTMGVQDLYNDFGASPQFPGLAWHEGDTNPGSEVTPFRQYVWLTHEASPNLFAEVGAQLPGVEYDPQLFMDKFLRDPFSPTRANGNPQYFMINGQSGFFSHDSPTITPMGRVGEPAVVHILNAGLWTHSMHLHANHFFVTSARNMITGKGKRDTNGVTPTGDPVDGGVCVNPVWVDVFNVEPMDAIDYTIPFMRPPDVPNELGIGLPATPLISLAGTPTFPPVQEFGVFMPAAGEDMAEDRAGNPIDLHQRMSPMCYPMHDHSEPSQTAQGGNYNCGLISGIYFTGDRNTPGHMNFPIDEDFRMMMGPGGGHRGVSNASNTTVAAGIPGHVH